MTLGEFLQAIAEWVYRFWPFRVVRQWEQGVKLRAGRIRDGALTHENGLLGTGLHAFWPVLGEIVDRDANIEVLETELQTVRLRDGTEATFSLGVRWRIRDLAALYSKVHSPTATVQEAVRSAAGEAARGFEGIDALGAGLGEAAAAGARKLMHGWGVEVIGVTPINLTAAPALRLIADGLVSQEAAAE